MRTIAALLFIAMLSACSSNKPATTTSRRDRATAEYDARTQAARSEPRRSSPALSADPARSNNPVRDDARPRPETVTPVSPSAAPDLGTGQRSAGEWTITSIKGKFLGVDSSTVRVYMNLTVRNAAGEPVTNPADVINHFLIAYVVYPDYNNRERLGYGNVTLNPQNANRAGDYINISFDVARPKNVSNALLLTEFTEINTGTKARNDLTIRFSAPKLSDRYSLFSRNGQQPQLRHYVNAGDTVLIRDVAGTQKPLYAFRYRHEFDAASSPMNTSPRPAPRELAEDSTFSVTTNQPFVLPKEGLYYFVEDTTDSYGIGLVVADKRFPKMTRPEKLVKPVLYMSTSTEIGELNQAQDTKKAFDRYWLSLMAGNEEVARRTLKAYFDRVEEANRLFTTYKEGWKTDKGMIYIVLGAPDRVQRNREREVWVYNRRANIPETNFTFTKKPNQFVEDHYELVRYIEYQPIWYPIVEAWRTGSVRE